MCDDSVLASIPEEKDGYDYSDITPLEWALYEMATIAYDYRVHPEAVERIEAIFRQLYKGVEG